MDASCIPDQKPEAIMNPKLIVINGKTYKSVDEMLDAFENMSSNIVISGNMKMLVDAKEFNSLADLPPDVRARYEQATGKLDGNQNGLPDSLERTINTPIRTTNVETSFGTEMPSRSMAQPISQIITPDTSNGWTLALVGLLIVLLCIALGVIGWMAFLR